MAGDEAVQFGYERVDSPEAKTARVRGVFASVAGRYDLMNDLMSAGLHRCWKDRLVAAMRPGPGQSLLDMGGGTGDIALRFRRAGGGPVTVCDLNRDMIQRGRARLSDAGHGHSVSWVQADAARLPVAPRSVTTYATAFALRNVTHIDAALAEAARVLRPGGQFFCLEFSPDVAAPLKPVYDAYSFAVLPTLGEIVAGDRAAYRYLAESIRVFPSAAELGRRLDAQGFARVGWKPLSGGICYIHWGTRI